MQKGRTHLYHLACPVKGSSVAMAAATAMWEAAKMNIKQQQTILKYMAAYFGRRLTVPESYIQELEEVHLCQKN